MVPSPPLNGRDQKRGGVSRTHFFLEGPKKKRFRAAKEKGPWESLGQIRSPPGAGERCEKAGSSPSRLRRYRAVLSWRVSTTSGRLPQVQKPRRPKWEHICPESRTAAGRNARKQSVPVITVFFGAGDRRTLHDPGQAFFFGVGTVSFSQKRNGPQENPPNSQSRLFFPASPDAPGAPG